MVSAEPKTTTVTIVYTGDTYGILGYPGWPGGLARRKTALDDLRSKVPHLLTLDTGNSVSPFSFSRFDKGELTIQAMESMGYDVLNLGSHEFDYGQERLLEISKKLRLLSSNISRTGKSGPFVNESIIKEFNGVKIGIIGLCDPNVEQETIVGNFKGLQVLDTEGTLKGLTAEIKTQTDLIILLSNIPGETVNKLAEHLPDIDIIISRSYGGESVYAHDPLSSAYDFKFFMSAGSTADKPPGIKKVIAYVSRYAFELGRIDITFKNGKPVKIQPSVINLALSKPEDPEMKKLVDRRIKLFEKTYSKILINNLKEKLGRQWVKEDYIYIFLGIMKEFSKAEIAVLNETSLYKLEYMSENIFKSDNLKEMDLQNLVWTDNHLVRKKMTGAQLKEVLAENKNFPYLHFRGLKETSKGSILVNGRPINNSELYSIVLTNYLSFGKHPWPTLKKGDALKQAFSGKRVILRDLFITTLESEAKSGMSLEKWRKRYQREKADPYPSMWKLGLDGLELELLRKITKNAGDFTSVPDPRITAMDQYYIRAFLHLWLQFDNKHYAWKTEVRSNFQKIFFDNGDSNIPVDSLIFSEQLTFKHYFVPIGFGRALPFIRAAYDTQFVPTTGNKLRKFFRFEAGLSSTFNGFFEEVRFGPTVEINIQGNVNKYGGNFYSKFIKPWNVFKFVQETNIFYFPAISKDSIEDLKWIGDFRQRFEIPAWKNVSISTYFDFLVWRGGKLIPKTGWNFSLGMGFRCHNLWKF